MTFPDEADDFRIYAPRADAGGWSIADGAGWLPIILADRDACLRVIELTDEYDDCQEWYDILVQLRDTYNHARPIINVTRAHIDQAVAEAPTP